MLGVVESDVSPPLGGSLHFARQQWDISDGLQLLSPSQGQVLTYYLHVCCGKHHEDASHLTYDSRI